MGERTKSDAWRSGTAFLLFKHLSNSQEEPPGTNAIIFHHWLQPGNLEPATIQIFSLGDEIASVNLIQSTIGIYTSDLIHCYDSIQSGIETLHDLFTHWRIHFFAVMVFVLPTERSLQGILVVILSKEPFQ